MRYIGGKRAGKVEDLEAAFLADVESAVGEGVTLYVEAGAMVSAGFLARVAALGVAVRTVDSLGSQALLFEVVDEPDVELLDDDDED